MVSRSRIFAMAKFTMSTEIRKNTVLKSSLAKICGFPGQNTFPPDDDDDDESLFI
jgi:hypothetical protein